MPIEALVLLSVDQRRNCIVERIGIFAQLEKRKRYGNNKEKKGGNILFIAVARKRCKLPV